MIKSIIALIPARSGSQRIPNKNIKDFCGHPLLAYTIEQAKQAGIFERIIVSSDSRDILNIAEIYGGKGIECPLTIAHKNNDCDIQWVRHGLLSLFQPFPVSDLLSSDIELANHMLDHLKKYYELPDCFSILRPTNPFRQPETIRRAWKWFIDNQPCDSIRAIEICKQHPYKMWTLMPDENDREYMIPLLDDIPEAYNSPYQGLPTVYAQNASLEIAWVKNVYDYNNVSGNLIKPFYMPGYEGFDINYEIDFMLAELLINKGMSKLPEIKI